jgi:hypothetical protein
VSSRSCLLPSLRICLVSRNNREVPEVSQEVSRETEISSVPLSTRSLVHLGHKEILHAVENVKSQQPHSCKQPSHTCHRGNPAWQSNNGRQVGSSPTMRAFSASASSARANHASKIPSPFVKVLRHAVSGDMMRECSDDGNKCRAETSRHVSKSYVHVSRAFYISGG